MHGASGGSALLKLSRAVLMPVPHGTVTAAFADTAHSSALMTPPPSSPTLAANCPAAACSDKMQVEPPLVTST